MLADEYSTAVEELLRESAKTEAILDYREILEEESVDPSPRPTISVVMRTQGKRPEGLSEALLCLFAQSCQDFEVVLIGHKLQKKQKEVVQEIIENQPASLREKIRFFELDVGGRTTPLNFGFAHSRGEYAAIFDDDDIVFEDWIQTFVDAASEARGKLIHAQSLKQYWSSNPTIWNVEALRGERAPTNEYCKPFNILNQLYENNCPPISPAFPLYAFRDKGIRFDESLDCVEDWD